MNYAFIDGQNLHLGTKAFGWEIDYTRFRVYLRDRYGIQKAYYFLGFYQEENKGLYNKLRESGFTLSFREHGQQMKGSKKGNVDTDIVFEIMRTILEVRDAKVFLVSGDGDYKRLITFLIHRGQFGKILFPNQAFASSLYKELARKHFAYLENGDVRAKIARTSRKKGSLGTNTVRGPSRLDTS